MKRFSMHFSDDVKDSSICATIHIQDGSEWTHYDVSDWNITYRYESYEWCLYLEAFVIKLDKIIRFQEGTFQKITLYI